MKCLSLQFFLRRTRHNVQQIKFMMLVDECMLRCLWIDIARLGGRLADPAAMDCSSRQRDGVDRPKQALAEWRDPKPLTASYTGNT